MDQFLDELKAVPLSEQPDFLDRRGLWELADELRAARASPKPDPAPDNAGDGDDELTCPLCNDSTIILGPDDSWLCSNCGVTGYSEVVEMDDD